MSLDKYLDELSDEGRPVDADRLADLSSISSQELALFLQRFAGLSVDRRREMSACLVKQAEDKIELNFDGIFLACLRDPDEVVRLNAIEGLWEYENRLLIEALVTLLVQDPQESVRAAAATGLGKFAMLAEFGDLGPADRARVEAALVSVIEDKAEGVEVRRRAVESIAALSLPKVSRIIREAYDDGDYMIRVSAIYAMGMNCDPVWLPTLLKELGNPEADIRYEAAVACGELGDVEAVPDLAALIDDSDAQVQLAVILALGRIGGVEAEAALRQCLDHPDEHIRDVAEGALEESTRSRDPFYFMIE